VRGLVLLKDLSSGFFVGEISILGGKEDELFIVTGITLRSDSDAVSDESRTTGNEDNFLDLFMEMLG
jgi:hypothetical protein